MEEQSTSKGFAILSTAAIAGKLLSVIYMPLLINIIGGNRPYAIYSVTYQIYAFIYVLTNTGVPSAISKLVSEFVAVGNTGTVMISTDGVNWQVLPAMNGVAISGVF